MRPLSLLLLLLLLLLLQAAAARSNLQAHTDRHCSSSHLWLLWSDA
jgi:hypothetical protein